MASISTNKVSIIESKAKRPFTISVALCTYNGADFIRAQLLSLFQQTRLPDEIVICDDHSNDGTVELSSQIAKGAHVPIRVITNPFNLGVTKNFEKAISLCSGDIIALCDQDDVWLPNKLCMIEAAFHESSRIGGVFSNGLVTDRNLKPLGYTLWESFGLSKVRFRQVADGIASEVLLKFFFVTGATLAFKRNFLDQLLPIPPVWPHDAWIAFVLSYMTAIVPLPQPLILYRQHGSNQIGASNDLRSRFIRPWVQDQRQYFNGQIELFKILYQHLEERGLATQSQLSRISEKVRHLKFRKGLPPNRLLRIPHIIRSLLRGDYANYSRHRLTAMRDLLSTR